MGLGVNFGHSLEVKPEAVSIILREMDQQNFARAGNLWADR